LSATKDDPVKIALGEEVDWKSSK